MSAIKPVDWTVSAGLVPYEDAVRSMEERVAAIARGEALERVWLLEHAPLYTAGTSAKEQDLLEPRFPVFKSGRGGQYTYHGPGQRVAYVMLDLGRRDRRDVRVFVRDLEEWIIRALRRLGVTGERRAGRVGIWVARRDGREDKIAAIGVRLKQWVSYHGISLNVAPNLSHYDGIVPCGIAEHGVTSLADLGRCHAMEVVDKALRTHFEHRFGPTADAPPPFATSLIAASA